MKSPTSLPPLQGEKVWLLRPFVVVWIAKHQLPQGVKKMRFSSLVGKESAKAKLPQGVKMGKITRNLPPFLA